MLKYKFRSFVNLEVFIYKDIIIIKCSVTVDIMFTVSFTKVGLHGYVIGIKYQKNKKFACYEEI